MGPGSIRSETNRRGRERGYSAQCPINPTYFEAYQYTCTGVIEEVSVKLRQKLGIHVRVLVFLTGLTSTAWPLRQKRPGPLSATAELKEEHHCSRLIASSTVREVLRASQHDQFEGRLAGLPLRRIVVVSPPARAY